MSQARQTTSRRPPTVSTPTPAAHDTELIDSMDELLDEIDSVLEEEDEFLLRYRQRGGQ
jgi:ubiquitin-like protein Pup